MLYKMLVDLSKSQESFDLILKGDNDLIKLAGNLTPSDFIYTSCSYFSEHAICKHFIALCKLLNIEFGETVREFVHIKKRGRPPKSNNGALNKN